MKRRIKIFSIIAGLTTILMMVYILRKIYKEKELKNLINGITKLNRNDEKLVSISDCYNRYLLKNDEEVDLVFNQFMDSLGWTLDNKYGRSSLYTKGYKEMLVKKIELVNGYCIFEWMDEEYIKNRVI